MRVLLGWELGAGTGHALRLRDIARRLIGGGHSVTLVLQRADAIAGADVAGARIVETPRLQRLQPGFAPRWRRPPSTHGDILARLGFDDPDLVAATVATWRNMLSALDPDIVIADYSPFLLLAARGAVPTMAIGSAFSLPPSELPSFPSLTGSPASMDEGGLLDAVNGGLTRAGLASLDRLPAIYEVSRAVPAAYCELDPYAALRAAPAAPSHVGPALPPLASGSGEEVYVYVEAPPRCPLWSALEASRLPVRLHLPRMSAAHHAMLTKRGFRIEVERVPFADIAARSRLLISHGGLGTVSSGLLAGLPQVVCYRDLEKALNGQALAKLGVGGHVARDAIDPARMAVSLGRLYEDEGLAARARTLAQDFRARHAGPSFVDRVMGSLAELV